MSLVSSYVKANDGKYYRDPVLSGKGWFIIFDDDDPAELVIKDSENLKPEDILNSIGLKVSGLYKHVECGRVFGGKVKDASCYFFELKAPIDVKYITSHDGAVTSLKKVGDAVIYDPKEIKL